MTAPFRQRALSRGELAGKRIHAVRCETPGPANAEGTPSARSGGRMKRSRPARRSAPKYYRVSLGPPADYYWQRERTPRRRHDTPRREGKVVSVVPQVRAWKNPRDPDDALVARGPRGARSMAADFVFVERARVPRRFLGARLATGGYLAGCAERSRRSCTASPSSCIVRRPSAR